jgi:tetratricopeptide (TPR) repeat protein
MRSAFLLGSWLLATSGAPSLGADLQETQQAFRQGDYEGVRDVAKAEVEKAVWNEGWPILLLEVYLTTGQYQEAVATYEATISRFSTSLRLRMLGAQAYRLTGNDKQARAELAVVPELIQRVPWRFTAKAELLALGEYYLAEGEDPKQVLELCYDKVIKDDPKFVPAHVAAARLAVSKRDDPVALASLAKAVALDEDDPEIFYLLARAWSATDPKKSSDYVRQALAINPRHIPSLLWLAELKLDGEEYEAAELLLDEIGQVNPKLPTLWGLRAAIAHLRGRFEDEGVARRQALASWPLNPEVDYLIGKNLSDHYRFAESVEYQRRALMMQADYVPAKAQLAQDLLRLGELDEGWKLVEEVRQSDPYDVPIFNLTKLRGRLEAFATLEVPGFVIRMDSQEAKIYGAAVGRLLSQARQELTTKYAVQLEEPIFVEIFPKQGDFAIRTFGLPGGDGFLGVCFGRLITANSPAALDVDSNWQAVLWHEYCHVVTLQKTRNRMPRWLSEGISVYEERQRDRRWGQSMTPTYRKLILGETLTPVSQLSSAFLQPASPMHLQFAYYEASLVVEYWIEKYGLAALRKVLEDLSVGISIDEALGRHSDGLAALDHEFAEFAKAKAQAFGTELDFGELDDSFPAKLAEQQPWLLEHPRSYWGLIEVARGLIQADRWAEALTLTERLQAGLPAEAAHQGGLDLSAAAYRGLGDVEQERAALMKLTSLTADNTDALERLIAIDHQRADWPSVLRWCRRMLEIDPLRTVVHEQRAMAAEELGRPTTAIDSLRALMEMDPIDSSAIHYRLARNLAAAQQPEQARRHVLIALEETPRYRDALRLLLKLQPETSLPPPKTPPTP